MKLKMGNVERQVSGETSIQKLKKMGYKEIESVKTPVKTTHEDDELDKKTVDELKAIAKEKGITGAGSLKKDELIAALEDVMASE